MADALLIYCSSTEPIYCPPPGDGLVFGCSFDGGRLVFATRSLPAYQPPAGDSINFGCLYQLDPEPDGAIVQGRLSIAGAAKPTLAYAVTTGGLLNIDGFISAKTIALASADGVIGLLGESRASTVYLASADGFLNVAGRANGELATPISADGSISLGGSAYYAPTWYTLGPLVGNIGGRWGPPERVDKSLRSPHVQAAGLDRELSGPWGELDDINRHVSGGWAQIPQVDRQTLSPWGDLATHPQADIAADYSAPATKQREQLNCPWDSLTAVGRAISTDYSHPGRNDVARKLPWDAFNHLQRLLCCDYSHPAVKDVFKPIVSGPYWYPRWCVRRYSAPAGDQLVFNFSAGVFIPPAGNALLFDYDSSADPRICYDGTWNGPKDAYWYKPHDWDLPGPTARSYYIIMNTVSLKRVADDVAIPILGMDISTDLDSWCWSLSATLRREVDLDLVRPSGGAPVEVEASINGNVWRFVIESYGHDRAYGSRGYSITGRSLSAYLADPYSLPESLLQATQMTAAQLADEALSGSGFSSSWQLTDWLVPAGVYSVANQTPMQQLLTIAAAAGGTVQSAMSATTISLLPWYAAMPWEWGAAAVEATLPSYQTKRTSYEARPQYSGVYVSGQAQGVMCFVKRTGTNGSDQPQMVTDQLITETEAGLARGKRILADSGPRSVENIAAPLFDDPGLLKPGMLIDVVDGGSTWRGMVTGCQISAKRPTVTQTLNVLRYHGS